MMTWFAYKMSFNYFLKAVKIFVTRRLFMHLDQLPTMH